MKTITLFTFLALSMSLNAQKLLWTSEFGGTNSTGAVVAYDINSTQVSTPVSLGGNPLYGINFLVDTEFSNLDYSLAGGLVLGSDGNYYGIHTQVTGTRQNLVGIGDNQLHTGGRGYFYRYVKATGAIEVLHSFVGNQEWTTTGIFNTEAFNKDVSNPVFSVVESSPGVFYGLASHGGTQNRGGVWKFDTNTNSYSVLKSFSDPSDNIGFYPLTSLIKGDGSNLYGLNRVRGGSEAGTLFKINTSTDQVSFLTQLDAAGWVMNHPIGQMAYIPSTNTIYGTKDRFDISSNWGGGVWSYNLNTNTQTNEWTILFSQISSLGSNVAGLIQGNDGFIYVTTRNGGANGTGTIIKYTPGGSYVKVFDFPSNFKRISGSGMVVNGTKIIAASAFNNTGVQLWAYDYFSNSYQDLLNYDTDPMKPGNAIQIGILIDNGNIVARSLDDSDGGAGSIFSLNFAGTPTILKSAKSREGRFIIGEMTQLSDSTFIGYIAKGGPNSTPNVDAEFEMGALAKFNVVNGNIQYLDDPFYCFYNGDYQNMWMDKPLLASNGKLYYTISTTNTSSGCHELMEIDPENPAQKNNLFKLPVNNDYEVDASGGVIELPDNKVVLAYNDSLYVYNIASHTMINKYKTHSYTQYGHMNHNIVLASNGKIYGTTEAGTQGTQPGENRSVIYSLNTTNFEFIVEHQFDSLVRTTNSRLTEYNGKLYGSTNFLGTNNQGHLFSYDMTTGTYTVEHSFSYAQDGGGFSAGWTLYNDKLYSTSRTGGQNGYGTLVEYNLTTNTFTTLKHLTMADGRSFRGTPVFWDDTSLGTKEIEASLNFKMYPNPADHTVTVSINNNAADEIEILSILGTSIKKISKTKTIDISDLSSGIYLIKIKSDNKELTKKLIVK